MAILTMVEGERHSEGSRLASWVSQTGRTGESVGSDPLRRSDVSPALLERALEVVTYSMASQYLPGQLRPPSLTLYSPPLQVLL